MAEAARFTYEDHEEVCKFLQNKTKHIPSIGIICGSGLGGLVDELEDKESIDYKDIPNFPVSTVPGHAGRLVFGILGDKPVVCLQGRFHFYEGYPLWKITMPVRIMKLLGVHTVFVTNAAGGINSKYNVGDFMVLKDHINIPGLAGNNPLCGPNEERFGPRFPSISDAYDKEMRKLAFTVAKELNMDSIMREGVYAAVSGPSFESPAELRFLQMVGADTVGMSTCPEVIVARHCGLRVFGMSLVTNKCNLGYDEDTEANHEEVLETGRRRAADLQKLVCMMVKRLSDPIQNNNKVVI